MSNIVVLIREEHMARRYTFFSLTYKAVELGMSSYLRYVSRSFILIQRQFSVIV